MAKFITAAALTLGVALSMGSSCEPEYHDAKGVDSKQTAADTVANLYMATYIGNKEIIEKLANQATINGRAITPEQVQQIVNEGKYARERIPSQHVTAYDNSLTVGIPANDVTCTEVNERASCQVFATRLKVNSGAGGPVSVGVLSQLQKDLSNVFDSSKPFTVTLEKSNGSWGNGKVTELPPIVDHTQAQATHSAGTSANAKSAIPSPITVAGIENPGVANTQRRASLVGIGT